MRLNLTLSAVLALPSILVGQQPAPAKAQGATPDLSGVWNRRNLPGARYGGYTFSAEDPSMTPWAQEKFFQGLERPGQSNYR
jgi:hypothetical protein